MARGVKWCFSIFIQLARQPEDLSECHIFLYLIVALGYPQNSKKKLLDLMAHMISIPLTLIFCNLKLLCNQARILHGVYV